MPLFGHHMNGYLEVEIMGHPFPTGAMEHALALGGTALSLVLMLYGLYALVRDLVRWRRRRSVKG
jgi:hypothetical protein